MGSEVLVLNGSGGASGGYFEGLLQSMLQPAIACSIKPVSQAQ